MKRIDRKSLILLVAGAIVMSLSLIVKHYIPVTDTTDGLIKGIGLGLIVLSLIFISMKKKRELQGKR